MLRFECLDDSDDDGLNVNPHAGQVIKKSNQAFLGDNQQQEDYLYGLYALGSSDEAYADEHNIVPSTSLTTNYDTQNNRQLEKDLKKISKLVEKDQKKHAKKKGSSKKSGFKHHCQLL